MNGTITLEANKYIIWKLEGKLEPEPLELSLARITEISKELNGEVYVFADVTNLRNISMSSRKIGLNWLSKRYARAVAVYGADTFLSFMIQKIIQVSTIRDTFKMVRDKNEAIEWTKSL